ncbi:WAKL6 [Acrasis kona]|uniref:WAKL6 n=1 Tax=Acrasis kona TaxID=1008807 RepID=A0AAW2ZCP0_9EUKA
MSRTHSLCMLVILTISYVALGQIQQYTTIDVQITPSKYDLCYLDVVENITISFTGSGTHTLYRFIPSNITSGIADVRNINATSLTDGIQLQDIKRSGYDSTLKGFVIMYLVYNPQSLETGTFSVSFTANLMTPTPQSNSGIVSWFFNTNYEGETNYRKVQVCYPSSLISSSSSTDGIVLVQVPTLSSYQFTPELPCTTFMQKNVSVASTVFIYFDFKFLSSVTCYNGEVTHPISTPPTETEIAVAVVLSMIGGFLLFVLGALGCTACYWCTHSDFKFKKNNRIYQFETLQEDNGPVFFEEEMDEEDDDKIISY